MIRGRTRRLTQDNNFWANCYLYFYPSVFLKDQEKFVAIQISKDWRRIAEIRHALGKDDIYKKPQRIFRSVQNTTNLKLLSQETYAFKKCWIRLIRCLRPFVSLWRYGISDLCGSWQLGLAVQQHCEAVVANPATFTVSPQLSKNPNSLKTGDRRKNVSILEARIL